MIKKNIFLFLLCFFIIPIYVNADVGLEARIGDKYYDTLEEAIANVSSKQTIKLISDVKLDNNLNINKTVNIDLNGNDISATSNVFLIKGGVLNLSGSGVIQEIKPNDGAIKLIGSSNPSDNDYSVLNVGKDVSLKGWAGVFVSHENNKSYGVKVNLDGKVTAVDDINGGTGIGVYINGNIKDKTNYPIINITDNANITSSGDGIYNAGYAVINIGKAYISGIEAGIAIKSGTLNIDGATVTSTGEDGTPTEGFSNGINRSGTAIQMESNSGYAGNMNLNIDSGTFKSKNSYVIYEYIGKGSNTLVNNIDISGGTFISEADKNVFNVSSSFNNKHDSFISGGSYSSNPSTYLKSGYTVDTNDNMYNVILNTTKMTIGNGSADSGNSFITILISVGMLLLAGILIYFNRSKIYRLFDR